MDVGGSLMDESDEGEVLPDDREERDDRDEPTELGGLLEYEYSSDRRESAKRVVRSSMVGAKSVSRSPRDAYGLDGLGWWILDGEGARPLTKSVEPRWCLGAGWDDFLPPGTSRMFNLRPVVGSTVYSTAGS